jgi:hypothetical protein
MARKPVTINKKITPVSETIQRANIALTVTSSVDYGQNYNNQKWYNSLDTSNGYVIMSDTYALGYSSLENAKPVFWTTGGTDELSVLTIINGLPGRKSIPLFTNTSSAFQWLNDQNKYLISSPFEPINSFTTTGAKSLYISNQITSFSQTGSIWYDESGYNNSSSLYSTNFDGNSLVLTTPSSSILSPITAGNFSDFSIIFNAKSKNNLSSIGLTYNIYNSSSTSIGQTTNRYNNIVCVFTNTGSLMNRKVYLNTDLISNNNVSTSFNSWAGFSNADVRTNANVGSGKIQSKVMFDRALSSNDIKQYFFGSIVTEGLILALDAGNIVSYESGSTITYSMTGSLSGSLVSGTGYSRNNGGCWVFDGVNDIINLGIGNTFFPLPQFTLEIWVQSSGLGVGQTIGGIWAFTYGLRAYINSNGTVNFAVNNNTGGSTAQTTITTINNTFFNNQWHHLVVQNNGTTSFIYVDGVLDKSGPSIWIGTTAWPTNTVNLGTDNNNNIYYLKGQLSLPRIYNRILTANEVTQNFNAQRNTFNV